MKLMMNGALTIGTLDGANVEIANLVGPDNIFIFGLTSDEVLNIYAHGNHISPKVYQENPMVKSIVDAMINGTFAKDRPNLFNDLYHSLVFGNGFPDQYLILADFESYLETSARVAKEYQNKDSWMHKAIINTAKSGFFSSDRSIKTYNDTIWHLR
jgi:starch phosphorylase